MQITREISRSKSARETKKRLPNFAIDKGKVTKNAANMPYRVNNNSARSCAKTAVLVKIKAGPLAITLGELSRARRGMNVIANRKVGVK